jgi:hypothetical protein
VVLQSKQVRKTLRKTGNQVLAGAKETCIYLLCTWTVSPVPNRAANIKKSKENNKVNFLEHGAEEDIWGQGVCTSNNQHILRNEEFHDLYSVSDM